MCDDFDAFLLEIGVTPEQMAAAKAGMPTPAKSEESEPFTMKTSPIEGVGCFATQDISGRIGKLWQGGEWYVAGRYINHSPDPNAVATMEGGAMFAYGNVTSGDEITLNYRQVRQLWEACHG